MLSLPFRNRRIPARLASASRLFSGEVEGSFILGAKVSWEMFTSYSHRLPFRPASGLEIRNLRRDRQEKN